MGTETDFSSCRNELQWEPEKVENEMACKRRQMICIDVNEILFNVLHCLNDCNTHGTILKVGHVHVNETNKSARLSKLEFPMTDITIKNSEIK